MPKPPPGPGSRSRSHERRRSPRYDALGQLNVTVVSRPMSVAVREIGPGGFSIETTEPITVGVVHRFHFYFDDEKAAVKTDARCVHSMRISSSSRLPIYYHGFEFEPDGATTPELDALLQQVKALSSS